VLVIVIVLG